MMAEKPVNVLHFGENDDDNDIVSVSDDEIRCTKLQLAEHIAAYIENRELTREVEPVACNNSLLEKITANYVIAKKILSNLSWQDKVLCKHVCSMWHSAVHALQKEQLHPADFAINLRISCIRNGINFTKSKNFYTEPLVVFTFANTSGFAITTKCEVLVPSPCEPACEKEHYLIDVIQQHITTPKNCMLTVKASYLSFMSLPHSITSEHIITHQMFARSSPFIGGVYIPKIPNVEFHTINIKSVVDMQHDFYEVVDKLAQERIVKGVLVYVTDSYLLHSVEDIVFLNYFKDVQPNVPYAMGGCIVEDTIADQNDITHIVDGLNEGKDFVSDNLITMGLFTVPKTTDSSQQDHGCNFDMFSLIIESSDWAKAKIQRTINEFANKVPKFEHSVVLKLSCVGRDQKHELEQDYFRAAFPNTRLVGCYGNGELGVNHPTRPAPEEPMNSVKRHRRDPGPQFGIMYSYSTVFVYIGWVIDVIQQHITTPKNCMLTVKASYLSFMSLPHSITSEHIITHQMFARSSPFIGGVYIPKIPNVEFHTINIKSVVDMQHDFYEVVDKLAQERIVKGVLVYVTDSYLLHSVEDIVFLNYFKDVQPNVPYAMGGCIVKDTIADQNDITHIVDGLNEGKDFVSDNLITMGLFTVPKTTDSSQQDHGCNFDMFSLIIESSDWAKAKIQRTINEFANKVPKFEHSVVLKLSCVGRDQKHELEQDYFRAAFPNTRLVGCYGNGELGVNHPTRPAPEEPMNSVKRHRRDPGPQFGIMYSYSTVFVYIGWGKILSQPECN